MLRDSMGAEGPTGPEDMEGRMDLNAYQRESTAHHEAGHGVFHVLAGHRFRYITLRPRDKNLAGHVDQDSCPSGIVVWAGLAYLWQDTNTAGLDHSDRKDRYPVDSMMSNSTQITVTGPTVTIRYDERGKPAETLVSNGDRRWSSADQVGALLPGWVMDALADALPRWAAAA